MTKITENEIFKQMLAGKPVRIYTETLNDKKMRALLIRAGIWKKDVHGTSRFWNEYSFKILYPIQLFDLAADGIPVDSAIRLFKGDYHLVAL